MTPPAPVPPDTTPPDAAAQAPLRGRWQALTAPDLARVDPLRTIALLPVSATEQHGPHLPLGTDALINAGLVEAAMQRLPPQASVLLLPALEIGDSLEHTRFPGTLTVEAETLIALWCAVGRSVARAGVRKLVIFNSHGGQRAHVDLVALRLRAQLGLMVVRAHSFRLGQPPGLFDAQELEFGYHAGAVETSLMLHLHPHWVRQEAIGRFLSPARAWAAQGRVLGAERPAGLAWMVDDLNPQGAIGDATQASAEKGRIWLDHAAGQLVQLLGEVAALPWPMPGGLGNAEGLAATGPGREAPG